MIGEGIHKQLAHLLQPAQSQETLHEKPTFHKEKSTALLVVS